MKKNIFKNSFSIIILLSIILLIFQLIKLNIIPIKYLLIVIISNLLLFICGLVLFYKKKRIPKIIGIIILILSLIINCFGNYYLIKSNNYIDNNFKKSNYIIKSKYYLINNKNSVINNKKDITKNSEIYYYKYSKSVDKALKIVGDYNYKSSDSAYDSLSNVLNNSDCYILISKADYDYFFNSSSLLNKDDFKIIYEFDVEEKIKINNSVKDSYNIYINGLDFTGIMRDYNLIVTVNTKTNKVLLTSIPRDYYIDVPAYNMKDTLMCLGSHDSNVSKEALEKLFDTKIDYTINLNTSSLVKVVDTLGGIEFCSDYEFTTTHALVLDTYDDSNKKKLHVNKGCRKYNGMEILSIARERNAFPGRDRYRQKNCARILTNIVRKLASANTLVNYDKILDSFEGLYTTDMNDKVIKSLIKSSVNGNKYQIIEQSVDGSDGIGIGHLGTQEAWIMNPDMNTVNDASNKISDILNEK